MIATHTDYKHPRHLAVKDGKKHLCFSGGVYYYSEYLCVSPGSKIYSQLNKSGLPSACPTILKDGEFVPNPRYKPLEDKIEIVNP